MLVAESPFPGLRPSLNFEGRGGAMGIRTTVVGSWWNAEQHEPELVRLHRGELSEDAASRARRTGLAPQGREPGRRRASF